MELTQLSIVDISAVTVHATEHHPAKNPLRPATETSFELPPPSIYDHLVREADTTTVRSAAVRPLPQIPPEYAGPEQRDASASYENPDDLLQKSQPRDAGYIDVIPNPGPVLEHEDEDETGAYVTVLPTTTHV